MEETRVAGRLVEVKVVHFISGVSFFWLGFGAKWALYPSYKTTLLRIKIDTFY